MTVEKISDSEWRIMRAIWSSPNAMPYEKPAAGNASPGITGNEIIAGVQAETGWSPKTVRTLLSRLVEKDVLHAEKHDGILHYSAKHSQEEAVRIHGNYFLERVFEGNARDLLVHFLKDGNLSQADAEELQALLEKAKKEAE